LLYQLSYPGAWRLAGRQNRCGIYPTGWRGHLTILPNFLNEKFGESGMLAEDGYLSFFARASLELRRTAFAPTNSF